MAPATNTNSNICALSTDFAIAVESEVELEQRHVDAMFNTVACFRVLSADQKGDFAGNLISLCSQKLDNLSEQSSVKSKNDFKMTHYFLHVLATKAELYAPKAGDVDAPEKKAKGKKKAVSSDSFQWTDWRPAVLRLFERTLSIDPSILWFMGIPEEAFLAGIWKYALQLLEDKPAGVGGQGGAEIALRALCSGIILGSARQLAGTSTSGDEMTTLCTAALDSICRMEHIGAVFSDICMKENGRFAAQLMAEVGTMNLTDLNKSGAGVKNVGAFLVSMSEVAPKLMAQFLPSFIHLLDSEVYQIRSSIIHVMGAVVSFTHDICSSEKASDGAAVDGENEERNQEQLKRVRDSILDMLIERTYDVSSFTRAAVLKTWGSVAEAGAIPLSRFEPVAELAVDRLQDRTAAVRKAAASLLISLLDNNPFGGVLAAAQFTAQEKELQELLQIRIEKLTSDLKEAGAAVQSDRARRLSGQVKQEKSDAIAGGEVDAEGSDDGNDVPADEEEEQVEVTEDTEVVTLRNGILYCSAATRFISAVELSVPRLTQMLASKTVSDTVEALRFIARSVKFGVEPCANLLHASLALIWHHEEAITKEVLAAFMNVYLTDGAIDGASQLLPDDVIAANLVGVSVQCGASELASMEKIIGMLFREECLNGNAVSSLWTMVSCQVLLLFRVITYLIIVASSLQVSALSSKALSVSPDSEVADVSVAVRDLAGALRVVAMAAKFCPSMLSPSRLNTVLKILLHPAVKQNMMFPVVMASAQCLQSLPSDFSPTSLSAGSDTDGSIAATRALLLDATEGICLLLVGDFIREDSEFSK
jgi:hypothetical protein